MAINSIDLAITASNHNRTDDEPMKHATMAWSTVSTLNSCQPGVSMLISSTSFFCQKMIEYCTEYVTKSEPRSQSLKYIFTNIVRNLKDGSRLCKSYSETVLLILKLPLFKTSRDFQCPYLRLDGSRAVEDMQKKVLFHQSLTITCTSYVLIQHYSTPWPCWSLPRSAPCQKTKTECQNSHSTSTSLLLPWFCWPKLCAVLLTVSRAIQEFPTDRWTYRRLWYVEAYAAFLLSSWRSMQHASESADTEVACSVVSVYSSIITYQKPHLKFVMQEQCQNYPPQVNAPRRAVEEWMLICQCCGDSQPHVNTDGDFDWTLFLKLNLLATIGSITAGVHHISKSRQPP